MVFTIELIVNVNTKKCWQYTVLLQVFLSSRRLMHHLLLEVMVSLCCNVFDMVCFIWTVNNINSLNFKCLTVNIYSERGCILSS